MNEILAIREKFDHMSGHSGYDMLYEIEKKNAVVTTIFCDHKKLYPRGIGRILNYVKKSVNTSSFYAAASVVAELKLFLKLLLKKYDCIHFTYGEPYFGLSSSLKWLIKSKIILTNHQPVSWWQNNEHLLKKFLKADQIIVLSAHDLKYWEAASMRFEKTSISYIPHGVDTEFFQPSIRTKNNNDFRIVFAGRYLRDINTLTKVIHAVSSYSKDINFDIIYFDKKKVTDKELLKISVLPNVAWHNDISETEFLNIYQNADCLLLPLKDCTANNALLEAMSCGLPIITDDLPAIHSYLTSDMSYLIKEKNITHYLEAIMLLYNNPDLKAKMGLNSRERALNFFDWKIITKQTLRTINKLVNG